MRCAGDKEENWRSALGHRLARQRLWEGGLLVQEGKECRRVRIEAAGKSPPDTDFLSCKEVTVWARQALPLALVLNCTHKERLPSEMASKRCGTWDQPVL